MLSEKQAREKAKEVFGDVELLSEGSTWQNALEKSDSQKKQRGKDENL